MVGGRGDDAPPIYTEAGILSDTAKWFAHGFTVGGIPDLGFAAPKRKDVGAVPAEYRIVHVPDRSHRLTERLPSFRIPKLRDPLRHCDNFLRSGRKPGRSNPVLVR